MKRYFVYMIKHIESGKVYVGRKTGTTEQYAKYWGTSFDALFDSKLIELNTGAYSKITLCEAKSSIDLSELESLHIQEAKEKYGSNCVNKHNGRKWTTAGLPVTEAHRVNLSKSLTGRVFTDEWRLNLSYAMLQRGEMTEQHKTNISKAMTGKSPSTDTREKLRKAITGKKRSSETRRKMKEAQLRRRQKERSDG